jgi:hypothetical protein
MPLPTDSTTTSHITPPPMSRDTTDTVHRIIACLLRWVVVNILSHSLPYCDDDRGDCNTQSNTAPANSQGYTTCADASAVDGCQTPFQHHPQLRWPAAAAAWRPCTAACAASSVPSGRWGCSSVRPCSPCTAGIQHPAAHTARTATELLACTQCLLAGRCRLWRGWWW